MSIAIIAGLSCRLRLLRGCRVDCDYCGVVVSIVRAAAKSAVVVFSHCAAARSSRLEVVAEDVRRAQPRQNSNGVPDHVQSKQEGDGGGGRGKRERAPTIQHETKRIMFRGRAFTILQRVGKEKSKSSSMILEATGPIWKSQLENSRRIVAEQGR